MHDLVAGKPPALDLKREAALQQLIVKLIRDGCIESAHDCAEGGLAVTLAECTLRHRRARRQRRRRPRWRASVPTRVRASNATLFGESASRIVVSVREPIISMRVMTAAQDAGVTAREIGRIGGDRIRLSVERPGRRSTVAVADAEHAWATAIENKMRRKAAS